MMDPQQRMMLKTTWQALEDAALNPDSLRGSRTGVYAGVGGNEYRDLLQVSNREQSYLGTNGSIAVGRVAFALGLQRGEMDLAIAGGVNAVLSPSASRFMVEIGMLSPAGHCRPFDATPSARCWLDRSSPTWDTWNRRQGWPLSQRRSSR